MRPPRFERVAEGDARMAELEELLKKANERVAAGHTETAAAAATSNSSGGGMSAASPYPNRTFHNSPYPP